MYGSTLRITEITSAPGKSARDCVLVGSGLPFMGAAWGGLLSMTTTWYPGNGQQATQQVVGPQIVPKSWSGAWRRTMLSRTPVQVVDSDGQSASLVNPADVMDFLEGIFQGGRQLIVTWSVEQLPPGQATISKSIVRTGRCKEWDWKFDPGIHDIEWTMSWEWAGRGATTRRVSSTRSSVVQTLGAAFESALQRLINSANAAKNAKFAPSQVTLGQLQALANKPSELMDDASRSVDQLRNQLGQVAAIATALASQPQAIAGTALNLARNTRQQAMATYTSLSGVGVETLSNKGDAASVLRAAATFGRIQDDARASSKAAGDFASQIRLSVPRSSRALTGEQSKATSAPAGSVLAVYVTRAGDTPQRLSQRFYGSPDHGVDILKANKLAWHLSTFVPGTPITIPTLASASSPTTV